MMSPASVIAQNARRCSKLCIAAGNGQYMAVEPADTRRVNANRRTCGPAETFRLIEVEADIYAVFNPTRGTYLSCQPDGRLEGNRTNLGPWEKFAITGKIKGDLSHPSGKPYYVFSFQCLSHQRRYVVAEGNGGQEVNANRAKIGPWEEFRMLSSEMASRSQARPSTNSKSRFPLHWGSQPKMQTKDLRPLPGGYGRGSSTLAKWIQRLDNDAQSGRYTPMVELTANGGGVVRDVGRQAFNEAFKACPVVRYRRNGAVMAVYQRLTSLPANLDAYGLFVETWRNDSNQLNRDFGSSTGTEIF